MPAKLPCRGLAPRPDRLSRSPRPSIQGRPSTGGSFASRFNFPTDRPTAVPNMPRKFTYPDSGKVRVVGDSGLFVAGLIFSVGVPVFVRRLLFQPACNSGSAF